MVTQQNLLKSENFEINKILNYESLIENNGFYWNNIFFGNNKEHALGYIKLFKEYLRSQYCNHGKEKEVGNISSVEQFDCEFIQKIFLLANKIRTNFNENTPSSYSLHNKSVVSYFLQSSLRTSISFEKSTRLLNISHFSSCANLMERKNFGILTKDSHYVRGESEVDIIQTMGLLNDLIIFRHPSDIFPLFVSWVFTYYGIDSRYINAGSGNYEHPTQALTDLYTIHKSFDQNADDKVFCLFGDCENVRSIRSFAKIITTTKPKIIYFINPPNRQISSDILSYLKHNNVKYFIGESDAIFDIAKEIDVLYMTRRGGEKYVLQKKLLSLLKNTSIILHPLPKDEEIHYSLSPKHIRNLKYQEQICNAVYIRSALILYMLNNNIV